MEPIPSEDLPTGPMLQKLARAARLKVPGVPTGFLATGRGGSLKDHFRLVRPEFAGQPRLCWICARSIILIRREIDLPNQWAILQHLLGTPEYREVLLCGLNTRWLIAICDTYADHGSQGERAAALCLSTLINLVKLAETERLILRDPATDPAAVSQFTSGFPHALWDGVTSYLMPGGDMPRNLFARMRAVLAPYAPLDAIGVVLLERLRSAPTLLSRLERYNPRFWH